MKILFVIDIFAAGGKERRLIELMKELILQPDIQFEIAIMSRDIHYKELFNLGITIHYIVRETKRDISVFFKFYKLCKATKPDVVHCWDGMTAVYLIPSCKLLNIVFVNGMVTDAFDKFTVLNKSYLRGKLTFPFSDAIVSNSKAGLIAYNAPRHKSYIIYNGFNFKRVNGLIEAEVLRKQLNIDKKYTIGMVAAFEPRKDYATLITAAIDVLNLRPDSMFLLIGEGRMKEEIMTMVPSRLMKNILFIGNITNVESFINIFDIAVLCTNSTIHREGISNSILEYMALGKPVIATEGGGTNEIIIDYAHEEGKTNGNISDNATGFLVPPFNAQILADKIIYLIERPELRTLLGSRGLTRIQKSFTIEKMCSQYFSLYDRSLKHKALKN